MSDAFISYSRKNLGFARLLKNAFDEENIDAWIDWQDIPPSADWLAEVYEAIENSDSFIFLISENSVISEVCSLELAHAQKNHKRIIPVVVNEVHPDQVPEPLAAINWIFFTEEHQFAGSFQKLIESIQLDQDWIRQHTDLQRRALDWERKDFPGSSLLRGRELADSEEFLSQAAGKDLQPTELQTAFIISSRQADARRRKLISIGAAAGSIILLALAVMALVQRSQAIRITSARQTAENLALSQAHARATAQVEAVLEEHALATSQSVLEAQYVSAVARSLAGQAISHTGDSLDTGLLLAVEAANVEINDESLGSLLFTLTDVPYLEKFLVHDPGLDITSFALSPDASLLVAASDEAQLLFYDTDTGQLMDTVPAPHQPADAFNVPGPMERPGVRFSLDGTQLLTVGENPWEDLWYLWDTNTRQPSLEPLDVLLDQPSDDILTVSADFRIMAAEQDEGICLWQISTGSQIQCLKNPPESYQLIRLSPDGTILLTASEESELQLWDTARGITLGEPFPMYDQEMIKNALISPDNSLLLATGERMTHLWELETGEELVGINHEPFGSPIYQITFAQDGRPVQYDNYFAEINATDLLNQTTIGGQVPYFQPISPSGTLAAIYRDKDIFSFQVYPDHNLALTFRSKTVDTEIILWDMDLRFQIQTLLEDTTDVHQALFHPIEPNIMAMTECSDPSSPRTCAVDRVRIVSMNDPDVTAAEIDHEGSDIMKISFTPSGELLALSDNTGLIQLWDWRSGELIGEFENPSGALVDFAISPGGSQLAAGSVGSDESTAVVWRMDTGELSAEETFAEAELFALEFSSDGQTLAFALGTHMAVWNPENDEEPLILDHVPGVEDFITLDFSPDGRYLAAGGKNGLMVWDSQSYHVISQPIPGQSSSREIQSLTFSPDSSMIAAGNPDHLISLWEPVSGRQFGPLLEGKTGRGTNALTLVSFNADGSALISTAWRTAVSVWNFNLNFWIESACSMANRSLTPEEWSTFMGDQPYKPVCQ